MRAQLRVQLLGALPVWQSSWPASREDPMWYDDFDRDLEIQRDVIVSPLTLSVALFSEALDQAALIRFAFDEVSNSDFMAEKRRLEEAIRNRRDKLQWAMHYVNGIAEPYWLRKIEETTENGVLCLIFRIEFAEE